MELTLAKLLNQKAKPLIVDQIRWSTRLYAASDALMLCEKYSLAPTPYFVEALAYWYRADRLQQMNLGWIPRVYVGDALQDAIPIYDTTKRRYAGFSNVLEQLWYGHQAPKIAANIKSGRNTLVPMKNNASAEEWAYLCLVHRVTGSGASFEADHGWRNTIVPELARLAPEDRAKAVLNWKGLLFTSIGNQIPPFNKKTNPDARLAGNEYLGVTAPILVKRFLDWLANSGYENTPVSIQRGVDIALEIQRDLGCKQFKFVLTAWVMDLAEYLPHWVDPTSDCYHGKNAQEALTICLEPNFKMNKQEFFDRGTRLFAEITGTNPMDVEDAAPGCDLIRWLENYRPKAFEHLPLFNSSSLLYSHGRQR